MGACHGPQKTLPEGGCDLGAPQPVTRPKGAGTGLPMNLQGVSGRLGNGGREGS